MHPDSQLKLDASRCSLLADEFQHFEIAVSFCIGQLRYPHVVSRNRQKERIGKKEIRIGDILEKIVANPQAQIEAIKPLGRQHREILFPHLTVVDTRAYLRYR